MANTNNLDLGGLQSGATSNTNQLDLGGLQAAAAAGGATTKKLPALGVG